MEVEATRHTGQFGVSLPLNHLLVLVAGVLYYLSLGVLPLFSFSLLILHILPPSVSPPSLFHPLFLLMGLLKKSLWVFSVSMLV